jgi:hypothetical protein
MTHTEQHKMILELKDYSGRMGRYEQEDFDMMVKRDKDDEDLDNVTRKHLEALYDKYVVHRPRKPLPQIFKQDSAESDR